ncbi:protein mesh-like, partial [Exaiptasia diaphana]|uniref:NIDO domain-containing protein n=1 Tax=Exaiptasia diaphana TaxID=2652724 RepID=A0A913YKM3_EXADI
FQCGFNAGDGINWKRITNTTFLDLPYTTNVNQPGIWMFRLDNAAINNGGCNTKGHLTIKPYKVDMLGGRNVELHGPCYENYNQIMCKFRDGTPSKGALISYLDDTLARCTVPMVFFIGPAKLYLSLDNGITYPYDGTFFY